MKDHAYIYSYEGMTASILGWILQQSPSYSTEYFCYSPHNIARDGSILTTVPKFLPNSDPWDNHSDDDFDWSHEYIACIEKNNLEFDWLNGFVKTFPGRGIFGLSYGAYMKKSVWSNPDVNVILSQGETEESRDRYRRLFINAYWNREFDMEELIEGIDMHVHDHKDSDPEYKTELLKKMAPAFNLIDKQGFVRFWQCQMVYHHDWEDFPLETEENLKELEYLYDDEISPSQNMFTNDSSVVQVDIFNLNIPEICDILGIEHHPEMDSAYNEFLEYCDEFQI